MSLNQTPAEQTIIINSLNELKKFTHTFASKIETNYLILLEGNLGAGKTTFVKSLLNNFNLPERVVKSPSFTLINQYKTEKLPEIYHLDLYRLQEVDQIFAEEIKSILNNPKTTVFIEWSEKLPEQFYLDSIKNILRIKIELLAKNLEQERKITINKIK